MPTDPRDRDDDDTISGADVEVLTLLATQVARRGPRPPDVLRNRIISGARAERFAFIRNDAGIWMERDDGGQVKELFHDSADRAATRLLRVSAGKAVFSSSIQGSRSIFVVSGGIRQGASQLGGGDFMAEEKASTKNWYSTTDSLLLEHSNASVGMTLLSVAASATWPEVFPGARIRGLAGGHGAPHELFVLDIAAHSSLGEHDHDGLEELFVLRGSCVIEGQAMACGDYHRAASGTHHNPTATEEGCMLLVSVRDLMRLAA